MEASLPIGLAQCTVRRVDFGFDLVEGEVELLLGMDPRMKVSPKTPGGSMMVGACMGTVHYHRVSTHRMQF